MGLADASLRGLNPNSRPEEERWILENDWEKAQLDDPAAVEGPPVDIEREKVVVVTGVSSGIGLATVKSLLDQGCHVFGSVRKKTDAEKLQKELGTPLHAPDLRCDRWKRCKERSCIRRCTDEGKMPIWIG
eukprot:jgi/Botrbrau1/21127/Bobra.0061s0021.1